MDQEPAHERAPNPLETGVLSEGRASRPTGTAWYDTSMGTDYGNGCRFDHEETATMTKIPSRKDR
jgi:hypothetical protein